MAAFVGSRWCIKGCILLHVGASKGVLCFTCCQKQACGHECIVSAALQLVDEWQASGSLS